MRGWRLCVLDGLRLERGSRTVGHFSPNLSPDRLMAYLLSRRTAVPVAEAVADVLPDKTGRKPNLVLNEKLHELRRRLRAWGLAPNEAREIVHIRGGLLTLGPDVTVDIDDWYARARQLEPGDVVARDRLRSELGRGVLAGFAAPWISVLQEEMESTLRVIESPVMAGWVDPIMSIGAGALPEPEDLDADDISGRALHRLAARMLVIARDAEVQMGGAYRDQALALMDGYREKLDLAIAWALDGGHKAEAVSLSASLWQWWHSRQRQDGREMIQRALAMPGHARDFDLALATHGAGSLAMMEGHLSAGLRDLDEAIGRFSDLRDDERLARAIGNRAILHYRGGDYEASIADSERAVRLAELAGDSFGLVARLNTLGRTLDTLGRDEAVEVLERAVRIAEEIGHELGLATAHELLGSVRLRLGEHAKAKSHYGHAIVVHSAVGEATHLATCYLGVGAACHHADELEAAARYYDAGERAAREVGDFAGAGQALWMRAECAEDAGDIEEAVALATQAVVVLEGAGQSEALVRAKATLDRMLG